MENRIKKIIATVLNVEEVLINENSSTQTLENWDSLNHMNIVFAIEEEFGITFDDEELMQLTSIQKIIEAVKKRKP